MLVRSDFEKIVDRQIEVLTTDAILRAWADQQLCKACFDEELCAKKAVVVMSEYLVSKEDLLRVKNWALTNGAAKYGLSFCKTGEKFGEKALVFSKAVKKTDYRLASNKKLFSVLREFDKKTCSLLVFLAATHPLAAAIESELRKSIAKRESDSIKADQFLATLTFPVRENTPVVESRELVSITRDVASLGVMPNSFSGLPPKIQLRFKKHAGRFGFLGARGVGLKAWSEADLFERVKELAKEPKNLKTTKDAGLENQKQTKLLMTKLGFSKTEKEMVRAAKEIVFFRTYRTEVMYHLYNDIENLLLEIGKRFGYSLDDLKWLTTAEILELEKQKISPATIYERKAFFVQVAEAGKVGLFSGKRLSEVQSLLETQSAAVSELKGTVACRGKATGTARIVLSSLQLDKVKKGDILVTNMTTPDFIPAMQRAAAFVTNEGGITCHAAIVAREMNKPCLIGTKQATVVFKDGDVLEVDAEKGFVRKAG